MITLEQTKRYDKMNLEQLEDLYTSTVRSIKHTDDPEIQINLSSKVNYLYSIILEKKYVKIYNQKGETCEKKH